MKKRKICFVCSSGGHYSEISNLSNISHMYESFLATEKTSSFKSNFCDKIYFFKEINRKKRFWILIFMFIYLKSIFIFIKERPTIVISTGALCSYPLMRIASFFKAKTIYIESFARVYDLSVTGKKLYGKVDLFLVQWQDLLKKYPKAQFFGQIYGELVI